MSFIKLEANCSKKSPTLPSVDPDPNWTFDSIMSELQQLESNLGLQTPSPLKRPPIQSQSRDSEESEVGLDINTSKPSLINKKSLEEGILLEFDREHQLKYKEFCVKKKDQVELMVMLGVFGSLVSACKALIFERAELLTVTWIPSIILLFTGYAASTVLFYAMIPFSLEVIVKASTQTFWIKAFFYMGNCTICFPSNLFGIMVKYVAANFPRLDVVDLLTIGMPS